MKKKNNIKFAFDLKMYGMVKAIEYICLKEGTNPYDEYFKGIDTMTKSQQTALVLSTYKKLMAIR